MTSLRWKERWRLLRLEADRRSAVFFLIAFLINLGFGCGMASANALLISRIGTKPLFFVYFGCSILTFFLAGLTYLLVDRHSRKKIFVLSFEIFAAAILFIWWFMGRTPHAVWPIFAARIFSDVFYVLSLLEFWLLAGDHFTNLEAKLRFPHFVASSALGFMLGSFLLQEFAQQFQAVNFFLVWGAALAVLPLFLFFLPPIIPGTAKTPSPLSGLTAETKKNGIAFPPSAMRLIKVLFLFWFAFTFFTYGVDYFFNRVSLQALPNENLLAAYFGKVAFFSFLAVFLFQLFIAGRLAMVLSVDRLILIFCVLLFIGTCLIAWSPSLGAVAVSEGLVFYFLDSKAISLLQPVGNLFPDPLRGRIKVVLDGFAPSSGDLLLLTVALGLSWTVGIERLAYVLAAGAALFLGYPFLFRKVYLNFLTDCLKAHDPKLVLNAVQALGEKDKKRGTGALLELLEESQEIFLKRNIILSLGRMKSEAALPKVIEQFSVPQESLQLAVIEALGLYRNFSSLFALYDFMKSQDNVSFQVRMSATLLMTRVVGKRMIPLLEEALQEEDSRIKANAIESLSILKDRRIIPLVLPYLTHPNRRIRANAAIALFSFRHYRGQCRTVITDLFGSEDPLTRFAGIYAIGELGLEEYRTPLIAMLKHPDLRHRQQVLAALAKMAIPQYVEMFVETILEEDESLALDSLRSLSRFPRYSRWMVFEITSKLNPASQEKIIARMDQTPMDFSQERELLTTRRFLASSRGRS